MQVRQLRASQQSHNADSAATPTLLRLLVTVLCHIEPFTAGTVCSIKIGCLQDLLHQFLKCLLHSIFCLGTDVSMMGEQREERGKGKEEGGSEERNRRRKEQ